MGVFTILKAIDCSCVTSIDLRHHIWKTKSSIIMARANAAVNQNAVAVGLEDLKNGEQDDHAS